MYSGSTLYGFIFLVPFLIGITIGILVALRRGFYPALVRLGMVVLCFVIAIPITAAIAAPISGLFETLMASALGDTLEQIATYSPTTMLLVQQLPIALVAPLLFIVVFFLLKLVTWIVFLFIKKHLPEKSKPLFRALSCVTGAVTSLITVYVIVIPLWGTVGLGHAATQAIAQAEISQREDLSYVVVQVEQVDNYILGPAVCNFTAEFFTDAGNSTLYRKLTEIELPDETTDLTREVRSLSHTAADALTFAGSLPNEFQLSDLNAEHINALRALVEDIDSDYLFKHIGAEWLSSMAQTWQNEQPFLGIAPPAVDTQAKPIIHTMYGFLGTTNADLLADDLNTLLGLMGVLIEHNMLNVQDQASLLDTFGSETFVIDLTSQLTRNDRLRNSIADLVASMTGAWAVGSDYMGMARPEINELLDPFMTEILTILSTTNGELIQDDLQALMDIVGVLRKHDLLNPQKAGSEIGGVLKNSTFIADLTQAISAHERFKPLLNSIAGLGLSALSSQLPTALPEAEIMEDISSSVSSALNNVTAEDGTIRTEAVQGEIDKIITENKLDVPNGVTEMISDLLIDQFKDQVNVTEQDVTDYLLDLYNSVGDLDEYFK